MLDMVFGLFYALLDIILLLWNILSRTILVYYKYLCDGFCPRYKSLESDIILITGAGNGLGRQLCIEFAPLCKKLVAWDIDVAGLNETAQLVLTETGKVLHTYECDLRNADAISQVANKVLREVGIVTVLVNNAGIYIAKDFLKLTGGDIDAIYKVNVLAHYHTIRAFLPSMMSRGQSGMSPSQGMSGSPQRTDPPRGHIVTVASIAGVIPTVGMAAYGATKAAALLMSESLNEELCRMGLDKAIHVTRVLPFLMDTKMFAGAQSTYPLLFPTVQHIDCARDIVRAVRLNNEVVYVYGRFRILALLKFWLPWPTLRSMFTFSGADNILSQVQQKQRGDAAKVHD